MIRVCTLAAAVLTFAAPAVADDSGVYESLSRLSIGRVFYEQSERDLLDARRGDPDAVVVESRETAAKPVETDERDNAAGYILGSSGKPRIWKHGAFVPSSSHQVEDVAFPGEVPVTRHDEATRNAD